MTDNNRSTYSDMNHTTNDVMYIGKPENKCKKYSKKYGIPIICVIIGIVIGFAWHSDCPENKKNETSPNLRGNYHVNRTLQIIMGETEDENIDCIDARTCNFNGHCNLPQNGTYCMCDIAWAGPTCNVPRKKQLNAFLLSFFLGPVGGAGWFYVGDKEMGQAQVCLLWVPIALLFLAVCCLVENHVLAKNIWFLNMIIIIINYHMLQKKHSNTKVVK